VRSSDASDEEDPIMIGKMASSLDSFEINDNSSEILASADYLESKNMSAGVENVKLRCDEGRNRIYTKLMELELRDSDVNMDHQARIFIDLTKDEEMDEDLNHIFDRNYEETKLTSQRNYDFLKLFKRHMKKVCLGSKNI
jgi:isopropylmalate/homocitrate/citramalate synthase